MAFQIRRMVSLAAVTAIALAVLNVGCSSKKQSTTTVRESKHTSEPEIGSPGEMESEYQMESPGTMIVE